jgi:hypothetical protein
MCDCLDCGEEATFTFECENAGCVNFICNYHSYEQDNRELWCSECAKREGK